MTVNTTASFVSQNGNGVTTLVAYPYPFILPTDLVGILVNADGSQTSQTLTTNYTISPASGPYPTGANITMNVAPPTGSRITFDRIEPLTQGLDLVENDPLPAEQVELSFDKLTMITQQLNNKFGRALLLSAVSLQNNLSLADLVANTVLLVNPAGTGVIAGPTADQISGASASAIAAAASAAAAAASAATFSTSVQTLSNKTLDSSNILNGVAINSPSTLTVSDNLFQLFDDLDPTKTAKFQISPLTTGTAVIYTMPATTQTIPGLAQTQTFTGSNTFSASTGTFGSSSAASTYNIGTGATLNATTKILNLGTAGVSGSTTNISLGSAIAGALGTTTINSPTVNFSAINTAINISYLTASRALATDGSKNLVSVANSGTGNNVLATSPTITTPNIVGVGDGSFGAAGSIGEVISSTIVSGSAIPLTTNTTQNVTSISLTAGEWLINGIVVFGIGTGTNITYLTGASTSVSVTLPGVGGYSAMSPVGVPVIDPTLNIPPQIISVASTTTIYMVVRTGFTVSTLTAYGSINALRVR